MAPPALPLSSPGSHPTSEVHIDPAVYNTLPTPGSAAIRLLNAAALAAVLHNLSPLDLLRALGIPSFNRAAHHQECQHRHYNFTHIGQDTGENPEYWWRRRHDVALPRLRDAPFPAGPLLRSFQDEESIAPLSAMAPAATDHTIQSGAHEGSAPAAAA
ncbi:hypothetical protein DFH07DRAFT_784924 [Mycena maculata]|uniref:Uncharacterized protein n=1 Tax=Mycena maculata TaxID=230809 RepID=A0AAD7HE49_9AGAR|nr:hypothetical protein DFH07DRAFT_784924 [Mycena maculata]